MQITSFNQNQSPSFKAVYCQNRSSIGKLQSLINSTRPNSWRPCRDEVKIHLSSEHLKKYYTNFSNDFPGVGDILLSKKEAEVLTKVRLKCSGNEEEICAKILEKIKKFVDNAQPISDKQIDSAIAKLEEAKKSIINQLFNPSSFY